MAHLLVTGARGHLGSVTLRAAARAGVDVLGTARPGQVDREDVDREDHELVAVDLAAHETLGPLIERVRPHAVLHLAAMSSPVQAYREPERARRVNVEATAVLARAAAGVGARFVFASTDLVFDGESAPYDEAAAPDPKGVYARTKREAELAVLALRELGGVVARLPWMYGFAACERAPSFFESIVSALQSGREVKLFRDEMRSALWYEDAAAALLALADSDASGVFHLGGPESLSRVEIGMQIAEAFGLSPDPITPIWRADVQTAEPRMRDCTLLSQRYRARFGSPPGRPLREALRLLR